MKKVTSSYSLSKDLYDEIEIYRKENKLSTKSQALERMLLERKFMVKGVVQAARPVENIPIVENQKEKVSTKKDKKKDNKFKNTINDIYDSMKD